MPFKDRAKSLESWKRWKARNPEKRRKYVRVQSLARYHHPTREKCSFPGCEEIGERHHPNYERPSVIIWLCKRHHEGVHHKEPHLCEVPDCGRKHWAKGFCNYHLNQFRRAGY